MTGARTFGSGDDCRGELLTAERRARLDDAGRLALDAHLASCASCRLGRDVAGAFDALDVVELHDGARIRALSEAAHRRRRGRPPRFAGRRTRALAAAAAIVVCCGSASAAVWWWRRAPGANVESSPAAGSAFVVPTGAVAHAALASRVASVPAAESAPPAPSSRRAAVRARGSRVAMSAVVFHDAGDLSAAALLRQATDARRNGQSERAADLYRRLKRAFPTSPEAALAAIPLGGLLLDGGLPRAAMAEFDAYLGAPHGGALIPEALYGRARALARLGDRPEERRTWQRLCNDFPGSAYAPLGRRRLAELE